MLILGSTLVAGAILLTALVALLFRRPAPPRWTKPDLVAMLVAVPLAALMALGLGYTMVGAHRLESAGALYQVVPALAVWVAAGVIWRLLGVRRRLRAYAAAERASTPLDVSPSRIPPAAPSEQPATSSHRRAA